MMCIMDEPVYMTPKQVAALFECAPATVNRWCRRGRLEHIRSPGGRVLIPCAAVEEIRKNSTTPDGQP
jgi:excisionase family DNA binding protein